MESVSRDGQNYFATVTAKPLASIERLRYVLLLWPTNEEMRKVQSISPADIRRTVQQRLENQGVEAGKVTKRWLKKKTTTILWKQTSRVQYWKILLKIIHYRR